MISEVKVEEILRVAGLFDEVTKQYELLAGIIRVVRVHDIMDRNTLIYRIAMTIYHSKSLTNQALIEPLEDPAAIYLKVISNPRLKKLIEEVINRFKVIPPPQLVKTFMCFLIAAYMVENTS